MVTANRAETCCTRWNLISCLSCNRRIAYYFLFKWAVFFRFAYQSPLCACPRFPLVPHASPILSSFIWSPAVQIVTQSSPASCSFLSPIGLCSSLMRKTACHTHAAQQAQLHLITCYVYPIKPISLSLQTMYCTWSCKVKIKCISQTQFCLKTNVALYR